MHSDPDWPAIEFSVIVVCSSRLFIALDKRFIQMIFFFIFLCKNICYRLSLEGSQHIYSLWRKHIIIFGLKTVKKLPSLKLCF